MVDSRLLSLEAEVHELVRQKEEADEFKQIVRELLQEQKKTNDLLSSIVSSSATTKDKTSNIEMRQNMETKADVQGATRHTEQWALGESANVSDKHLDVLINKLLEHSAELGQLSYGYEMMGKDRRRTHGIFMRLWLRLRDTDPLKIQWQAEVFQTGFGIEAHKPCSSCTSFEK